MAEKIAVGALFLAVQEKKRANACGKGVKCYTISEGDVLGKEN